MLTTFSLHTSIYIHAPFTFIEACIIVRYLAAIYIYTRIIKYIFNKSERRCRDVKTQKAGKQGWEANIGPKIKRTTSI